MRNKQKIIRRQKKKKVNQREKNMNFFSERKKDYLIEFDSNIIRFLFCFVDG